MGTARRVPARAWLVAAAVLLAVPAVAEAADPPTGDGSLAGTRDELSHATDRLEDVRARLDAARDEFDRADARLARAGADLGAARRELAQAEDALAAARVEERETAEALAGAEAGLDRVMADWNRARNEVRDRAADAYMHGGTPGSRVLLGILHGGDLHDLAVTTRTVERLTEDERSAMDQSTDLARVTAGARAGVAGDRAAARRVAAAAAREQRRVADLTARAGALVAEIAGERARRAEVIAALEADEEAAALLVSDLEARLADLRAELAEAFQRAVEDIPFDGPPPAWAGALPAAGRPWAPAIDAAAASVGMDGRLLAALVWTESSFQPAAVSSAGAVGLAQLMPGTAAGLRLDPWDPLQNLVGGARYLTAQMHRFGRADLALAAYNAGPGRVEAAGGIPGIVETQLYVVRVLERYDRIAGA